MLLLGQPGDSPWPAACSGGCLDSSRLHGATRAWTPVSLCFLAPRFFMEGCLAGWPLAQRRSSPRSVTWSDFCSSRHRPWSQSLLRQETPTLPRSPRQYGRGCQPLAQDALPRARLPRRFLFRSTLCLSLVRLSRLLCQRSTPALRPRSSQAPDQRLLPRTTAPRVR